MTPLPAADVPVVEQTVLSTLAVPKATTTRLAVAAPVPPARACAADTEPLPQVVTTIAAAALPASALAAETGSAWVAAAPAVDGGGACGVVSSTDGTDRAAAAAGPEVAEAAPVATPPPPHGRAERRHRERLQRGLEGRSRRRQTPARDPAWQGEQRQLERLIRADAVEFAADLHSQGLSLTAAAGLLDLPPRTLRQWQHDLANRPCIVKSLGRPHVRCSADNSDGVIGFLHSHGPWVGLPSLRSVFPDLPRAELRDLLAVFRHLWGTLHPHLVHRLHWHQVGSVWAIDFTHVAHPIDGLYPYVLAVRDLASGCQLAWQPVADTSAASAVAELELLFTIHGAPLVLKSDNGSAFRAGLFQARLGCGQVWPLYSPPGQPGYNGAIEASIAALKKRTQFEAWRSGHAGAWTSADLERARHLANTLSRPRGGAGPTPAEAWQARRPPTMAERAVLAAQVHGLEAAARRQGGLAPDVKLDHYAQAALHRRVLQEALVDSGLLTITRRRIPQRFFGHKAAKIW